MGRWAQRKRSGGGPPDLNYMIGSLMIGTIILRIEYANAVDASQFTLANFHSEVSGQIPDTITQLTNTKIELYFLADIDEDVDLIYSGTVPGIRTPQTLAR